MADFWAPVSRLNLRATPSALPSNFEGPRTTPQRISCAEPPPPGSCCYCWQHLNQQPLLELITLVSALAEDCPRGGGPTMPRPRQDRGSFRYEMPLNPCRAQSCLGDLSLEMPEGNSPEVVLGGETQPRMARRKSPTRAWEPSLERPKGTAQEGCWGGYYLRRK